MSKEKPALVASSRGDVVIFHEKGENGLTVRRNVSSIVPSPPKTRLSKESLDLTYTTRGKYDVDKSVRRGYVLARERDNKMILKTVCSSLKNQIHVTKEQLESFGWRPEGRR